MPRVSSEQVAAAAEQILGDRILRQPERQRGYSNANWRVDLGSGSYLVKTAARDREVEKVTAASNAYRLAATTAAPVQHEIHFDPHCALLNGLAVRILEWLPGRHVQPGDLTGEATADFFSSLGRAVAELHTARCPGFSSRIGGSPVFGTWCDYLDYRIPRIIDRNKKSRAFDEAEIEAMFDRVRAVAGMISDHIQPRLCHRDLYLDNFLIGDDGRLAVILDLDLAEAWDPSVDFVKLRSQVFPEFEGSEEAFTAGYTEIAGLLPGFDQRVRVVEVLELSNHVINSVAADNDDYAGHNRRRLDAVLAADW